MFETLPRILLGLLTGFLFGFLLQKGGVSDRRVIRGQFLLRDFTVMKVMMTAVLVGGIGVYALKAMGLANLAVKPAQMGAIAIGAAIFGVGMVVLGYCPGTAVAAAGEGKRDAWAGMLGMLIGAFVFVEVYPWLKGTVLQWADLGKVTLPDLTGLPPAGWFAILLLVTVPFFVWLDWRRPVVRQ